MISAVVLAAGEATRMGFPKLFLPLSGKSILRHTVDNALASKAGEVIVVVGREVGRLPGAGREVEGWGPLKIVENREYHDGQSTSLKAGVAALSPSSQAALFMLADQPLVTADILNGIIDRYQEGRQGIVVPVYGGRWGNPVLFPGSLFSELMVVSGDKGGRDVVQRHRAMVDLLPVPEVWAGMDVDTWEDYLALVSWWETAGDSLKASGVPTEERAKVRLRRS